MKLVTQLYVQKNITWKLAGTIKSTCTVKISYPTVNNKKVGLNLCTED